MQYINLIFYYFIIKSDMPHQDLKSENHYFFYFLVYNNLLKYFQMPLLIHKEF